MNTPKRIVLVIGVGTSPQVLTETVWELAHRNRPLIPDEILVLADKRSADSLKEKVLSGGDASVWNRLLSALRTEGLEIEGKLVFGTASIAVIPNSFGNELLDLRSSDDSLSAADYILGQLRRFTESSDTVVLASIAGGRKTMSALIFSCMTLVGRDEDKILHVLLPVEIDGGAEPPFYFPEKGVTYTSRQGRKFKGETLRSELLEIPFVRTRGWYQERFGRATPSYRSLIAQVGHIAPPAVVKPKIEIDLWKGCATIDGRPLDVGRAGFAVLVLAASGVDDPREMIARLGLAHKHKDGNACSWMSEFMLGQRFSEDGTKMLDDLSKVKTDLRSRLKAAGFCDPESLIPKSGKPVRHNLFDITWRSYKRFCAQCGYFLPGQVS